MKAFRQQLREIPRRVRSQNPLVHNITNYVAMNFTANALLAVGASPIMAHAAEEVAELARLSGAVVLNIGTLEKSWVEAMRLAAEAANDKGVPLILDPVGAGASALRDQACHSLLERARFALIRGNASEVTSLTGIRGKTKGVDSTLAIDRSLIMCASRLAAEHRTLVAVTGAEDILTDGTRTWKISGGHPLLGQITASGCALSALCGAFLAVGADPFLATAAALAYYAACGEMSAKACGGKGPGSFQVALLDTLSSAAEEDWTRFIRLAEMSQ